MSRWKEKRLLHGADYYPEQWLDRPEILEEDIRLMKLAQINLVTLGVFAWAALEPQENVWNFEWLDGIMDRLYENGIDVVLATPSGARPAWLAQKYPEVLRVTEDRQRNLYGMRMNHCYTSPEYRRLTERIDRKLAQRYGSHPALKAWHISNEYHGECHCQYCQQAFRDFLKEKYESLECLNRAWWTGFWSKTYTDWLQIESPSSRGERAVQGLELDWKRFVTKQTGEFLKMEIAAVKSFSSDIPITTNMIGSFPEVDYPYLASSLDVAALDVYPEWGKKEDWEIAQEAAFEYDVTRSLKRIPFLLMETTPSRTNWTEIGKLKAPGLHTAGCLQAIAHGAETIQYFQWRKSRGAFEKFHGAVIGHCGHENTRVFREVRELGEILKSLEGIAGTENKAEAAVLFDWNNRWAIEGAKGPCREKYYVETVKEHHSVLRTYGINVDLIDEEKSLEGYRLVIAPMLYMIKPGLEERLRRFVEKGGNLVLTYFSGIVDENDLCFQGGFPGPLRKLSGIWAEELDTLYPGEENHIVCLPQNRLGLEGSWSCRDFCEVIHLEGAQAEAVYGDNYYQGQPVLTRHDFGEGQVWYLAARANTEFLKEWYGKILTLLGITVPILCQKLPKGVELSVRQDEKYLYAFFIHFGEKEAEIDVAEGWEMIQKRVVSGKLTVQPRQIAIVRYPRTLENT